MGFEELGKKLVQLGQDTKSGVQKMGEAHQVNSRLGDEKHALQKLYAAIGREIYKRYRETPPEGLEDEFAAVKTAQESIDKLSEQLGRLKNVIYCSECGREAARGEQFCSGCGAKLPETEEDIKEKVKQDAREAAGEAGAILGDFAEKARDFMGGVGDKADAFSKGVASRMSRDKKEEDIVDMPWEEAEEADAAEAETADAEEAAEAEETAGAEEAAEAEETAGAEEAAEAEKTAGTEETAETGEAAEAEETAGAGEAAEPEEAVKEKAAEESACSEKDEPKPVPGEPEASARAEEGASEDAE